MSERDRIMQNYEPVWQSIDALLGSMSEDDWSTQSLCPDWTMHGVISHLAGIEHALSGWLPEAADEKLPFDLIGGYIKNAQSWSGAELAADYRRLIDERRQQLLALSDDDFARPSPTPVGPATYGRFMDIRVFDFWVHERDIRIPLDRPADSEAGPSAERSVDEVAMSIGYIVGKKIGLPDGKSIQFDLTGGVPRTICAAVIDGRAKGVESLESPDVTVTADSSAFVMLACGRVDPQEQIDAGRISWTGDEALGDLAARNLRFTF